MNEKQDRGKVRKTNAVPAIDPPRLAPWNGFDHNAGTRLAEMCRRIAEVLADDEWHDWRSLFDEIAPETMDLQEKTLDNGIRRMAARGDVHIWRKNEYVRSVRLAGRWQGYKEGTCPQCGQSS